MTPKSAVILCGGLATRMKGAFPMPKSLIPLAGISVLERQINALIKLGIPQKNIVLAAGNGERYEAFQKFIAEKKLSCQVIFEKEQLGTGGALKNALSESNASLPTLVFNGDILCDFDQALQQMCAAKTTADAVILGHYLDPADECGLLSERPDGTIEFQEKVPNSRGYINAGIYLLDKSFAQFFPETDKFSIEYDVFPKAQNAMVKYDDFWFNLTNPDIVAEVREFLEKGDCHLRPWGGYTNLHEGVNFKVKILEVKPNQGISLQYHNRRSESWVVVTGVATVQRDDEILELCAGETVWIPQGARHRLSNKQAEPLILIETQIGDYFGEDDIVRLEDIYGRPVNR